jgi:aqualysin 1
MQIFEVLVLVSALGVAYCQTTSKLLVTSTAARSYPGCVDISTALGSATNIYACPATVLPFVAPGDKVVANAFATAFAVGSWGLDRIDQQRLPLDGIYNPGPYAGSGVNVYILDSGIDVAHPDFEGRVSFLSNHVPDGRTDDCVGHGTFVAGIILSKTFGVANKARGYSVRVLNCGNQGSWDWIISGINSVVAHARQTGVPSVINLSFGGPRNAAVDAAVEAAVNAGIHVVIAAGNDATDTCNISPANVPGAITVMATTDSDAISSFSNYGPCVDIAAPGSSVISTFLSSKYAVWSGTSMAAPHVAGVAAVMISERVYQFDFDPNELQNHLKARAIARQILNLPTGTPNLLLQAEQQIDCSNKSGDFCDPTDSSGYYTCSRGRRIYRYYSSWYYCYQRTPTSVYFY